MSTQLVHQLQALSTETKIIRKTLYTYPPQPPTFSSSSSSSPTCAAQHHITSWKVQEEAYRDPPFELPTMARGLFTERVGTEHRIVSRGYEKFFNIDEMEYTKWDSLDKSTRGPYYLTLKSNGCLILMSAIEEDVLLVTSKHALGDIDGDRVSHNHMGHVWVKKHLSKVGKTEKELANVLWNQQLTAVAELCDDSFEEHVLSHASDRTGLHLHGLNHNTTEFSTLSPYDVAAFAREWGFIETKVVEKENLAEAREFAREVEEREEFDGEKIEGFVVRCTVGEPLGGTAQVEDIAHKVDGLQLDSEEGRALSSLPSLPKPEPTSSGIVFPPYPANSSFFFKIKFDQPYLLYRNFREIAKCLLPLLTPDHPPNVKIPPGKLSSPEAVVYEGWCRRLIRSEPELFQEIAVGKGIIQLRSKFLDWVSGEEGGEVMKKEKGNRRWLNVGKLMGKSKEPSAEAGGKTWRARGRNGWGKTVLVPVAVPACGKTAIAVALTHLFGFSHTQSDDINSKKTAAGFNKAVDDLLCNKDVQVVIADRNNHLVQHRKELATTALKADHKLQHALPTRLIALYWPIKGSKAPASPNEISRICSERITQRGENHQSLRPDPENPGKHEAFVKTYFLHTAEPLLDGEVDGMVELDIRSSVEETLSAVLDGLVDLMGLDRPSDEAVRDACKAMSDYQVVHKQPGSETIKVIPPRYYAIAPELDLQADVQRILDHHFSCPSPSPAFPTDPRQFFFNLITDDRITARPHITLVHEAEVAAERTGVPEEDWKAKPGAHAVCWNQCRGLALMRSMPLFEFVVGHLVWDDRVMALAVEEIRAPLAKYALKIPEDAQIGSHFTVGTRDQEVNAYEARALVKDFRNGVQREGMGVIKLEAPIQGRGRILGLS